MTDRARVDELLEQVSGTLDDATRRARVQDGQQTLPVPGREPLHVRYNPVPWDKALPAAMFQRYVETDPTRALQVSQDVLIASCDELLLKDGDQEIALAQATGAAGPIQFTDEACDALRLPVTGNARAIVLAVFGRADRPELSIIEHATRLIAGDQADDNAEDVEREVTAAVGESQPGPSSSS